MTNAKSERSITFAAGGLGRSCHICGMGDIGGTGSTDNRRGIEAEKELR
jgi:hypothetical protein